MRRLCKFAGGRRSGRSLVSSCAMLAWPSCLGDPWMGYCVLLASRSQRYARCRRSQRYVICKRSQRVSNSLLPRRSLEWVIGEQGPSNPVVALVGRRLQVCCVRWAGSMITMRCSRFCCRHAGWAAACRCVAWDGFVVCSDTRSRFCCRRAGGRPAASPSPCCACLSFSVWQLVWQFPAWQ